MTPILFCLFLFFDSFYFLIFRIRLSTEADMSSYRKIKNELEAYRMNKTQNADINLVEQHKGICNVDLLQVNESITQGESTHEPNKPTSAIRQVLFSCKFQFIVTFLLWIAAVQIGFGAVWFVLAALYWIWVWGTNKSTRSHVPGESIVSAGFYFDTSPFPLHAER
ncbi:hypothetical protein T265_02554 [Opisthorchis viverrini]|uniref:SAYSvFN domain-containing protein n=1 Tax=Opisthorchis viverrini TaxID=6198 RepID=A0A075AI66_OPIVI|nr:hypothetical protein T265_02554 [Opisthorchis viverrini]KER31099.1 hypothetical protein T265_02554 [Opisthorchis viverrini]